MLKKVVFILNPISGINRKPGRIAEWIHSIWKNSQIDYEILKTGHRGHGVELAKDAAAAGADMVIAAGGDGTINEIGRGLIGSETALGIIPAGSGNGFARNLNIPLNQKKAITLLREPNFRKIDVGKINEHYFFNIAGSGVDAEVSAKFDQLSFRGLFPYLYLSLREFLNFKAEPVVIHLPGKKLERTPILVSIANLPEYGNSAVLAPGARPDDGLLDLCIFNQISLGKLLRNMPKFFNGKIIQMKEMEIYRVKTVKITRKSDAPIHTDGDPHFAGPLLSVSVLPRRLKVAVVNDLAVQPKYQRRDASEK